MCGIFGIITSKPAKFDYRAFSVLGVNNDSRGGDSCGIFIDGNYEYGVLDKKLFSNFMQTSPLLNSTNRCSVALGHCRKASVGAIDEKRAQPVVIHNPETNIPEFVVLHNGTIYNYEEMAKKYIPDVDIKDMTDSQVFARIFYYAGYEVLGEYRGGASFVIADYRKDANHPEILFFKGKSKIYNYAASKTEEERPMFVIHDDNKLIFSSIPSFLLPLMPYEVPYSTPANCLISWSAGKFYKVKEFKREEQFQCKDYGTTQVTYYRGGNSWDGDQDWDFPAPVTKQSNYRGGTFTSHHNNQCTPSSGGIYTIDKKVLHGPVHLSAWGYKSTYPSTYFPTFYFWEGVLLKNCACYTFLEVFAEELGITPSTLLSTYPEVVYLLSPYPYRDTGTADKKKRYWVPTSPNSSELFTGEIQFLFSNRLLKIKDGKPISVTQAADPSLQAFLDKYEHFKINYELFRDLN